jgi:uncharacterized protein
MTDPQPTFPRTFHVVVKPLGATCNLDCAYCYYHYKEGTAGCISDELLERFIRQYIAGQEEEPVVFNWHGGEPALLGLGFFRKVLELERKYADGHRIENDFQTNGVLLDESWCEFLKEHGFNVGLSIDGPKHLHDHFRKCGGAGSFDRVYRAARLLRQFEVPFNALTVVHAVNARHPDEVYGFLTEELGCRRLQWLPCVGHKDFRTTAPGHWDPSRTPAVGTAGAKPGNGLVTEWSVDADDWGEFLCRTFDLWFRNDRGRVFVNWFESLVGQWMGKPAQICSLAPVCGRSLVTMEKDGSLYSCDHFVYPEYRLGNLSDDGCQLADVVYSPQQRQFGCAKRESLPDYCRRCKYNFACNGECPKNRFLKTPDGQPGLNYLCPGTNRFLTYADPYLTQIVAALRGSGAAYASA